MTTIHKILIKKFWNEYEGKMNGGYGTLHWKQLLNEELLPKLIDDTLAFKENLTKHNNDLKKVCPKCKGKMDYEEYWCCNNKGCIDEGIGKPIIKS